MIYIVEEFPDMIDSVWDDKEKAVARKKELDESNRGEFAEVYAYELNTPVGYKECIIC